MCWPETGLWIKRKFQETSIHHTSLALIVGHWNHSSLLKEQTTNSQCYAGGAKVKGPFLPKWGGIYSQGGTWSLWLFDFRHDRSTSYELSYDMTLQLHMCVFWTFTLHYILLKQVWSIVVMWLRQVMTQLDMILLTCIGWIWWQCRATMLLSDGCAINLSCLHLHMEKCSGSWMVLVFAWWCTGMHPFHLLLDVLHTFVQLRESLLACAPSSSCSSSCHVSSMCLIFQLLMTRQDQIQKSPILT